MLNQVILTGNLGADPEVFYGGEGDQVATFNIAFRSTKQKTCWVKVVTFNKQAETVERYLHKGARITVIGILDQQRWEDEQGNSKTTFQIIANTFEFIKTDGRGFDRPQDNIGEAF